MSGMWVLVSNGASGLSTGPDARMLVLPILVTTILALSPQVYLKLLYQTYYVRISVITRRSLQTCLTYLSRVPDISTFARFKNTYMYSNIIKIMQ